MKWIDALEEVAKAAQVYREYSVPNSEAGVEMVARLDDALATLAALSH